MEANADCNFQEFLTDDYFATLVRETTEELGLEKITDIYNDIYTFHSGIKLKFNQVCFNLYIAELF